MHSINTYGNIFVSCTSFKLISKSTFESNYSKRWLFPSCFAIVLAVLSVCHVHMCLLHCFQMMLALGRICHSLYEKTTSAALEKVVTDMAYAKLCPSRHSAQSKANRTDFMKN